MNSWTSQALAPETEGLKRLIQWVETGKVPNEAAIRALPRMSNASHEDVAIRYLVQRTGCTRQAVIGWLSRRSRPSGARLKAVASVLGCSMKDWQTEEERTRRTS